MGFEKFWKVLGIDSAVFQDLESFGTRKVFQNVEGKFWMLVWENSKICLNV